MDSSPEINISENNFVRAKDCEDAINKINSNGLFQKVAFILLTICYTCTGAFITNSFIFLEKDPPITCYTNTNQLNNTYTCTRQEACKVNTNTTYKINYLPDQNYSWTNDFQMGCDENVYIGLFASLFFVGSMISSLVSPSLSDFLGRAKLIKIAMVIRIFFITLPLIARYKSITIISLFFLGFLNPMHSTIPYILLSEYLTKEYTNTYLTYMFMFESFSGIFATLFFYFLQNWVVFYVCNLVYGIIFVIFSQYLYESPRFLYANKRYKEAAEVLRKISKINNIEVNIIFEIENQASTEKNEENVSEERVSNEDNENNLTTCGLFGHPKYKKFIMILPLIWFLDAFAFFAINFMIKYLNRSIYFMNTILFLSEAVSYFLSVYLMGLFGKRNVMIFSFGYAGISFIIFYFISAGNNLILIIILIFSAKFGASVVLNVSSIYTNDCFPTHIRGRSTAICSFLGKFGGVIAPMIVETSGLTGIVSGVFCILAAFVLLPLDNNLHNAKLKDQLNVGNNKELADIRNVEVQVETSSVEETKCI